MIQTPMYSHGSGRRAATSPGVRRIPMPIVFPIVTASPKPTPRTARSRPRERVGEVPGGDAWGGAEEGDAGDGGVSRVGVVSSLSPLRGAPAPEAPEAWAPHSLP